MDYKYIVHYIYGEVGNSVGCYTSNQADEIAEAITLRVRKMLQMEVEISIQDVETGEVTPFFY